MFKEIISSIPSVIAKFGDSVAGRTKLYQTADVVLLLLNHGMTDASGKCTYLPDPEDKQKEYRFALFSASYSKQ